MLSLLYIVFVEVGTAVLAPEVSGVSQCPEFLREIMVAVRTEDLLLIGLVGLLVYI